jgi:hypothetical protein
MEQIVNNVKEGDYPSVGASDDARHGGRSWKAALGDRGYREGGRRMGASDMTQNEIDKM